MVPVTVIYPNHAPLAPALVTDMLDMTFAAWLFASAPLQTEAVAGVLQ